MHPLGKLLDGVLSTGSINLVLDSRIDPSLKWQEFKRQLPDGAHVWSLQYVNQRGFALFSSDNWEGYRTSFYHTRIPYNKPKDTVHFLVCGSASASLLYSWTWLCHILSIVQQDEHLPLPNPTIPSSGPRTSKRFWIFTKKRMSEIWARGNMGWVN